MSNPLKPGQKLHHFRNDNPSNPYSKAPLGITVLTQESELDGEPMTVMAISICSHQEGNFSRKRGFSQVVENMEQGHVAFVRPHDMEYALNRYQVYGTTAQDFSAALCDLSWANRLATHTEKVSTQLFYLSKNMGLRISEEDEEAASKWICDAQAVAMAEEDQPQQPVPEQASSTL